MPRPTYERVLAHARHAVKDEFEKPFQGGYYDTQSVLVACANEFQDLDTNNDEDEELTQTANIQSTETVAKNQRPRFELRTDNAAIHNRSVMATAMNDGCAQGARTSR